MGNAQSELTDTRELRLHVKDVSEQKSAFINDLPRDSTIGELLEALVPQMKLPVNDALGRPLTYQARLAREGRALQESERVGDSLQPEDQITLLPSIMAGGRA